MRFVRVLSSIAAATLLYPLLPAHAEPYRSLFNQQALDSNPQQYCSDKLGQQVQNNKMGDRQNNAHVRSHAHNEAHQDGNSVNTSGGLNVSVLGTGFGGSASHGQSSNESNAESNSDSSTDDTGYQHEYDLGTVRTEAVGKDCNAFNQAAAERDIAHMNYDLQRKRDSTALFHSLVGW